MLNLHQLSIFHAVADAGSVSGGAQRLMISQPAVSKQIRQMEKALKTRLFDRHANGIAPTAAGLVLAEYTRRIFGLLAEAESALDDFSTLRRGSLSIGTGPTVGVYLLPSAMVRFRREHPQVQLRAETEGPELLRQRLMDGMIELAISESPIHSPELVSKVLFEDVLVPVAGKGQAIAAKRSISANEFASQPFIARQVESDGRSLVERTLSTRGLNVTPVLTVSSTEAIKQAVIAGLGVAMVSRLAIQTEIAAGLLVELKVKGLKIRYPIHHICRKGRSQSKIAGIFLKMILDCAG
jgi:DNA-binding transcriptional LysR family regulator